MFNIVCSAVLDSAARAILCDGDAAIADIVERTPAGVSMVLDPTGAHLVAPHQGDETIVYAEIDVAACVEPKQFHDVVGYYNRFDIFRLTVDRAPREPISFEAAVRPAGPAAEGEGAEGFGLDAAAHRSEPPRRAGH